MLGGQDPQHHGSKSPSVDLYWKQRTSLILAVIVAVLIVLGLSSHILRFGFGLTSEQTFGFIRLFDLNLEQNIPTWFSSIMLASCALMLTLISFAKRMLGDLWLRHWFGLSAIFLILSLDETAVIHERSSKLLHILFDLNIWFTNAWVLIAWPLLVIFFLLYLRFLLNLPRRTRWLFLSSGALYVCGSSGIEVLSGVLKYHYGTADLRFALMTTLEEALELLGILAFVYALTDYAAREKFIWRLTFTKREVEPGQGPSEIDENLTDDGVVSHQLRSEAKP